MKKTIKIIICAATALFYIPNLTAEGITQPIEINHVYVREGTVDIYLKDTPQHHDNCSTPHIARILAGAYPNTDLQVSAALTAKVSSLPVRLYIEGCSEGRYPIVKAIMVR